MRHPRYAAAAIIVAALVLLAAIWLPNLRYIADTVVSSIEWRYKIAIVTTSLGALNTNFTATSRAVTVAIALLAGLNTAMFAFYVRERRALDRLGGVGMLGTALGLVSVGCAACGSVILSSLIGFGATAAFVGVLPFHGAEMGVAGIAFLLLSIWLIARKITSPGACRI